MHGDKSLLIKIYRCYVAVLSPKSIFKTRIILLKIEFKKKLEITVNFPLYTLGEGRNKVSKIDETSQLVAKLHA
jgi:hypothetical protein